jgi:hypothetical protein
MRRSEREILKKPGLGARFRVSGFGVRDPAVRDPIVRESEGSDPGPRIPDPET